MKKILLVPLLIGMIALLTLDAFSQNVLQISTCHEKAIEHSPLQKQILYLETISQLNSDGYKAINYPKLILNGQATYQSDVFSLPFPVPGIDSPIIPQEQYKIAVDFYQNIYNGGASKSAREIEEARKQAELQALEVSFHQIREVVNSLYFGILKAQEQVKLIQNVQQDMNNQKNVMEARISEGAVLPISAKILEKEIISLEQQLIELESVRSSLLIMLGKWLEEPLDGNTTLEVPETDVNGEITLNRPESKQFASQIDLLESQKSQLAVSRIPDIGLFGTAGVGNPNPLNWFDVQFTPYWLAGIRLSWNILDYGKASNNREVLGLQQQSLMAAKDNFERSVDIGITKQESDILKFELLIEKDLQIVKIQEEIVAVSSSQLANGVINSNDYVLEVNRGLNANISLRLHQIDLAKTKIELLTSTGNIEKL